MYVATGEYQCSNRAAASGAKNVVSGGAKPTQTADTRAAMNALTVTNTTTIQPTTYRMNN